MTRVSTHLMFQGKVSDALAFYASVFSDFQTIKREDYGVDDAGSEGTVKLAIISFHGAIPAIDSPIPHDLISHPRCHCLLIARMRRSLKSILWRCLTAAR